MTSQSLNFGPGENVMKATTVIVLTCIPWADSLTERRFLQVEYHNLSPTVDGESPWVLFCFDPVVGKVMLWGTL